MKVGIIYATKRDAATVEIVKWMSSCFESMGHEVKKRKPDEFDDFDCDLYVLGTAVYCFSAKRAGLHSFIKKNRELLSKKPTVLFIVCGADPLKEGETGFKRKLKEVFINPDKYMESVESLLLTKPAKKAIFKGYQEVEEKDKINFDNQLGIVESWCKSIMNK